MGTVFSRLHNQINILSALTEEKIAAVAARDPQRLLTLLQSEIDPMRALDRFPDEVQRVSPQERHQLRIQIEGWKARTEYLQQLLQQHLGYIDFIRSFYDMPKTGLNLDL